MDFSDKYRIFTLDDLRSVLPGMMVLAILVLGTALTRDGTVAILEYGLAIAAGIVAIAFYVRVKHGTAGRRGAETAALAE